MTFTLTALLAVFTLLVVTSGVYFLAQRIKLPYTVLLVAVGSLVLVPLSNTPLFGFLREFFFTQELLFYVFLPVLIFESAYNISTTRLLENIRAVSVLSIVSLIASTGLIGWALFYVLPLIGISVPLVVCMLFGALISATDPVAVLALFKEFGAPRRLTLIFEGESVFNDGTAVALFLVILGIAAHGFNGMSSVVEGIGMFSMMVLGGVLFGTVVGLVFVRALSAARTNEFVQITLMLAMAHLTFILTDFISQHLTVFGHSIHLSAIIATTLASLVLGNYGRAKVSPRAEEFVDKFWAQSAFLANSIVFILIGLIFSTLPIKLEELVLPIAISVLVVAVARALSIYPVVRILNRFSPEAPIPMTWQHLLAWGSLRGALAITMVLLIPSDLVVVGWTHAYSVQEFVLGLTIGCIFATLFIKATTIEWLMRKLGVSALTDIEKLELEESRALLHERVLETLDTLCERGHMSKRVMDRLRREHSIRMHESSTACDEHLKEEHHEHIAVGERVLRMYAIGLEREALQRIYDCGEVNERVYRRIMTKLERQYDDVDMPGGTARSYTRQNEGPHESVLTRMRAWIAPEYRALTLQDQYMYYRTQNILSRAVLDIFARMAEKQTGTIFGRDAFQHVHTTYTSYLAGADTKMHAIEKRDPLACEEEAERIARHSILGVETRTLEEFSKRRMITPKVYALLHAEITEQADKLSTIDEQRAEDE